MVDIDQLEDINELKASLEALLFVSPQAVTPAQLAAALEISVSDVEAGLEYLNQDYKDRGLRLQRHAGHIQLTTAPEFGPQVERFLGLEISSNLSRAALEALAIVAYQEPVTRPQVDSIRGVNSDGVMKSLLHKGLIQDVGRAPGPGRPILYSTTPDFLQHFGISSTDELPPLEEQDSDSGNGKVDSREDLDDYPPINPG
jgi:segregation and condensation protein B